MSKLFQPKLFYIFLLIVSPIFIWNVIHPQPVFTEWSKAPSSTLEHFGSLFTSDNEDHINLLRVNSLRVYNNSKPARFFTYQVIIPANAFFDYVTFFSPRIYFFFQEGDGSSFYPPGVDPIPFILFPLFIWGLVFCITTKRFKQIILLLIFAALGFLPGRKTFPFLFPVFLIYLYFIEIGFSLIKNYKYKLVVFWIVLIYAVYLYGRLIWIPK